MVDDFLKVILDWWKKIIRTISNKTPSFLKIKEVFFFFNKRMNGCFLMKEWMFSSTPPPDKIKFWNGRWFFKSHFGLVKKNHKDNKQQDPKFSKNKRSFFFFNKRVNECFLMTEWMFSSTPPPLTKSNGSSLIWHTLRIHVKSFCQKVILVWR